MPLPTCLVVIEFIDPIDAEAKIVGMGVLYHKSWVMTCAHVINAALNRNLEFPTKPDEESRIQLRFALDQPATNQTRRLGKVVVWHPPAQLKKLPNDFAILQLDESINEIIPAAFSHPAFQQRVRAYGYPCRQTEDRRWSVGNGGWVFGSVDGDVDRNRIQIRKDPDRDTFIEPGYSGTGVLDYFKTDFLGLAGERNQEPDQHTARFIPTRDLQSVILIQENLGEGRERPPEIEAKSARPDWEFTAPATSLPLVLAFFGVLICALSSLLYFSRNLPETVIHYLGICLILLIVACFIFLTVWTVFSGIRPRRD